MAADHWISDATKQHVPGTAHRLGLRARALWAQCVTRPVRSASSTCTTPATPWSSRNVRAAPATPSARSLVASPSIVEPAPDQHDPAAPPSRKRRRAAAAANGKQAHPVRLVQDVVHRAVHPRAVIGQSGEQQAQRAEIVHRVDEGHLVGQHAPRLVGREFFIGDHHDESPLGHRGRADAPRRRRRSIGRPPVHPSTTPPRSRGDRRRGC